MFKKLWLLVLGIALIAIMSGCAPQAATPSAAEPEPAAPVAEEIAVEEGPVPEPEALAPEDVTQSFYDWYLDQIGPLDSDTRRNLLVEGTFKESPYLTERFVGEVEETLASFDRGGYDPILLAQDIPVEFEVQSPTITGDEATAIVLRFWGGNPEPTPMTVHLVRRDGQWLIDDVTPSECAETLEPSDPVAVATAFYEWYLAYIGDPGSDNFRNPLVDRAYRGHPQLTEEFQAEIDALLDSFGGAGYDPFLMAQDIPRDFSVEPGPTAETALVHLAFGTESVRNLLVGTVMSGNCRLINSIEEANDRPVDASAPPAAVEGSVFVSDELGFALAYPETWVMEELSLQGPGMPEDWPVVAGWQIMPPEVAEALANASPPDPNAPPIIAPFQLEVVIGDEQALQRVYPVVKGEAIDLNGIMATHVVMEPGYEHFIVPHPYRSEMWIVLTDWVTLFPGREAMAEMSAPAREQLLNNLTFTG